MSHWLWSKDFYAKKWRICDQTGDERLVWPMLSLELTMGKKSFFVKILSKLLKQISKLANTWSKEDNDQATQFQHQQSSKVIVLHRWQINTLKSYKSLTAINVVIMLLVKLIFYKKLSAMQWWEQTAHIRGASQAKSIYKRRNSGILWGNERVKDWNSQPLTCHPKNKIKVCTIELDNR